MKKYKYIRLNEIEKYGDWDIVKIIESKNENYVNTVVIMYEDKLIKQEPYLSEATNQELINELNKRLESEVN